MHSKSRENLHAIDVEQALLGALLLNNALWEQVSERLTPACFADVLHGKIYEAIGRLVDRGRVADPLTLKDYFERDKTLDPLGGVSYLFDLIEAVVSVSSITDYGRMVYDAHVRRRLTSIGQEMISEALSPEEDESASDQIEKSERKLYDLAVKGESHAGAILFSSALAVAIQHAEAAFKRDGHLVGITSGFRDIDKYLGGLHPSDLLILAGRPSMGKTALATNIAFQAAKAHLKNPQGEGKVVFFSLEMSAEQLAGRILSSETRIPSDHIRRGEIRAEDFEKFLETAQNVRDLPFMIDDTASLTISGLRNRARRIKRQHGLSLIVVDYLQLLNSDNRRQSDSRVQEISEITRGLKGIAKELNVPVLALSQLSRAVEQREDKRPQLSDLRESGSIEQDSDVVMFVFREEYYEERRCPDEGSEKFAEWQRRMNALHNKAELIIAKQRHGPIGTIKLFFDGRFTKFGDLSEHSTWFEGSLFVTPKGTVWNALKGKHSLILYYGDKYIHELSSFGNRMGREKAFSRNRTYRTSS